MARKFWFHSFDSFEHSHTPALPVALHHSFLSISDRTLQSIPTNVTCSVIMPLGDGQLFIITYELNIRRTFVISVQGIKKFLHMSIIYIHIRNCNSMFPEETIVREQSIRAVSRDIRNANSVRSDSMAMMNCLFIVERSMRGASSVIGGLDNLFIFLITPVFRNISELIISLAKNQSVWTTSSQSSNPSLI